MDNAPNTPRVDATVYSDSREDWNLHPLGQPEHWPAALLNSLSALSCIDSPALVCWSEQHHCFFNKSWLSSFKHDWQQGMNFDILSPQKADLARQLGIHTESAVTVPLHDQDGRVTGYMLKVLATQAQSQWLLDRLYQMAEQSPVIVFHADDNGTINFINRRWTEQTGLPSADAKGEGWKNAFHPDDIPAIEQAMKSPATVLVQARLRMKNGDYRYFEISAAHQAVEGKSLGILGRITDIDDVRSAQNRLLAKRQIIEDISEQLSAAAETGEFDYDLLTKQLTVNDVLRKWFAIEKNTVPRIETFLQRLEPRMRNEFSPEKLRRQLFAGETVIRTFAIPPTDQSAARTLLFRARAQRSEKGTFMSVHGHVQDLTDAVERRHASEEAQRKLELIVEQAPVAIAIHRGPRHIVELANEQTLRLLARTSEQVLGRPLVEAMPELRSQGILEIMDRVLATGKSFTAQEFNVKMRRNGKDEELFVNFTFEPLTDAHGQVTGIMAVGMEMTEQVKFHRRIEQSEAKLNVVIDASGLATWELNLVTREVKYSDTYPIIIGYPRGTQLSHDQIVKHIHRDDLELRNEAMQRAFETGQLDYRARLIWNDGSLHWIEGKGRVFYDRDGKPSHMLGTVRDITPEMTYQQTLLERELRFRTLADSMPQLVWTADKEGRLNYFNQSFFDYSGLSPADLSDGGWMQIVHPDEKSKMSRAWDQAVSTGTDFLFEHRFIGRDGEYRWHLSRARLQSPDSGLWIGTSTDIQEQKTFSNRLEQLVQERTRELERKNIDLESMNKELESFAYVSSHDLQEPLRKIQTFADRIVEKEAEGLSPRGLDYFRRIQEAAERVQKLIMDLLAYSRTGSAGAKFESVELMQLIRDVQDDLSETIREKKCIFEIGRTDKITVIPFQFRQLLGNLLSNSLKFSAAGREPVISISSKMIKNGHIVDPRLSKEKIYFHILYRDNGIGFDPGYNERIFEMFQRLNSSSEYKGTGIGLSIVKKIVENHRGIIRASGNPGVGATFDIFIEA